MRFFAEITVIKTEEKVAILLAVDPSVVDVSYFGGRHSSSRL